MPTYCIDTYGMMFTKTGHSTASRIDRRWNGEYQIPWIFLILIHNFLFSSLGANHKTLHRHSQATAAHHPHLVKVQIVSTTAHRHRPLNVHHRKRHRVWTTTPTATIWSTTSMSSRLRRSRESVTTWSQAAAQWMVWGHRICTRTVAKAVRILIRERETAMTTMGE